MGLLLHPGLGLSSLPTNTNSFAPTPHDLCFMHSAGVYGRLLEPPLIRETHSHLFSMIPKLLRHIRVAIYHKGRFGRRHFDLDDEKGDGDGYGASVDILELDLVQLSSWRRICRRR